MVKSPAHPFESEPLRDRALRLVVEEKRSWPALNLLMRRMIKIKRLQTAALNVHKRILIQTN
jgi:hypothetical protein